MARWLLRAIIFSSLYNPFAGSPPGLNSIKSLFGGSSRRTAEPSAGPSSRTEAWDISRTDDEFRTKIERFRRALRRAGAGYAISEEYIYIHRGNIFEDSFDKTIGFSTKTWKKAWTISFIDELGYGVGVKREWYTDLILSTVDRGVQLFIASDGDRNAYTINPNKSANDETLQRFKFIGLVVAKAVFDGQLLPMYFTRSMYKHILGKQVDCTDLAIEEPRYYQSLQYIRETDVDQIKQALRQSLKWTVQVVQGGMIVERELIRGGQLKPVTNDQRERYVNSVCKMKLHTVIKKQLDAFLTGFYDIIPKAALSIFNERELQWAISGPPVIDVDDWERNTIYIDYTPNSPTIKLFWETLRSFTQEQLGQFLHFVTGSSKPPLRGFAYLDGSNEEESRLTIAKGDVLKASLCTYIFILPPYFDSQKHLKRVLLTIIESSGHGFNQT